MLGISGMLGSSGGGDDAGNHASEVGVVGSVAGEFKEEERGRGEEGDRNSSGSRWPRQETLALLKIRSDMDVAFRDSNLKAPLWDEVSRKLSELGYHRSAKKCKEKFENVYKYYKRTKDGRASKQDGKAYRFFDQLEALDNLKQPSLPPLSPDKNQSSMAAMAAATTTAANPAVALQNNVASSLQNLPTDLISTSTASSSSSGEESEGTRKKKRKMAAFFDRLMKEVIAKQENLQKKFLEAIEKREHDRMVREEAWKMQEMARMNREHEMLVQERSIAAAKDAAVIAFLQKISEQSNPVQLQENSSSPSEKVIENPRSDNAENFRGSSENFMIASSSRWPKAEVEALIKLRTSLDLKYQDNVPKGPLWEEISTSMKKLGYDRSAKRCKEKWENINKYFKKVKESNKKRPEDSKTCPYFQQLDELYKEKTKRIDNSFNPDLGLKAEDIVMQMMNRPEQPQPLRQEQPRPESVMEDLESENMDQNQEGDDEDEDENEVGGYEIVTNHPASSMAIAE